MEVIAEGKSEHTRILRVVTNRGIRWNSTYLMIKRAINLKDALTLYQDHDEYVVDDDDCLTKDDWLELSNFNQLPALIYKVSMLV